MKHIKINNPRKQELEKKLEKLKQEKRELIKPINKKIASVTQMLYREQGNL